MLYTYIITNINQMAIDKEKMELLDTLRYVKHVMDSDDYTYNFDDLYERISAVIAKYENV